MSLLVALAGLGLFALGYRAYGARIERLYGVDPGRPTPARELADGVDYVPARSWFVLLGHHFAAIAGAAPIVGPVIAVGLWGWVPTAIWVVAGCVLLGAVHDFGALMVSVRHRGRSIAEVAGGLISRQARALFLCFVLLALLLVVAVFAHLSARTFVEDPRIVVPSLGLIPIALLLGQALYVWRMGQLPATALSMLLLGGLLALGPRLPVRAGLGPWMAALFAYCYLASIAPVHWLLQPRDYLCGLLLVGGMGLGYLGLAVVHPPVRLPAWRGEPGLWPLLCVTVACGAISGFHGLVASGTTVKQLASESHARRIGYGGMLLEGAVALLALLCVAGGLSGMEELRRLRAAGGPIHAFSVGYGFLTAPLLGPYGRMAAVTVLNAFILSSLDAATRIARYVTEELLGLGNRYLSTSMVVGASALLACSGTWSRIWPVFGAANQLVAALSLLVVACWLARDRKPLRYVLPGAAFLWITCLAALARKGWAFLRGGQPVLLVTCAVLACLAVCMGAEAWRRRGVSQG